MTIQRTAILVLIVAIAGTGACSSQPTLESYLDSNTGASIRRVNEVLEFYRDASRSAAFANDLLSIAPFEVNRAGTYQLYLWVARWSSVKDRSGPDAETLFFFVDGEPVELTRMTSNARSIGLGQDVYESPTSTASIFYFALTAAQLRKISTATEIAVATGAGGRAYGLWSPQPGVLSLYQEFAKGADD